MNKATKATIIITIRGKNTESNGTWPKYFIYFPWKITLALCAFMLILI